MTLNEGQGHSNGYQLVAITDVCLFTKLERIRLEISEGKPTSTLLRHYLSKVYFPRSVRRRYTRTSFNSVPVSMQIDRDLSEIISAGVMLSHTPVNLNQSQGHLNQYENALVSLIIQD